MKTTLLSFFFLAAAATASGQATAPVDVTVHNTKGKPYAGDKVYFVGQKTKASIAGVTNAAGKFHIELPQGDTYDIRIKSIGEEVEYNTLEIPSLEEGEHFEGMELLITYEAPKSYTLDNLQFESGKATIRPASYASLNNLIELMQLKPTMNIEVAGHTDSEGEDAANQLLSQQRAEAVKKYLIQKGIAAARITAKGYGETRPVADNATEKGRQQNRRTEINVR